MVFFGNGYDGGIGRMSANGLSPVINWRTLAEPNRLRGGLHVDETGLWNHDLIIVAGNGNDTYGPKGVWRIDGSGASSKAASITTSHLEGVITMPEDEQTWGPWSGRILTGDEYDGIIYAIDKNGAVFEQWESGCVFNGHVSIIDSEWNAYAIAFSVSNCQGTYTSMNGSSWDGMATLAVDGTTNTLVLGVTGKVQGITFSVVASLPEICPFERASGRRGVFRARLFASCSAGSSCPRSDRSTS